MMTTFEIMAVLKVFPKGGNTIKIKVFGFD
jgi:hypothetical protein